MFLNFTKFLSFQVDLIDMMHLPDGDYKYILHAIDHWSRFNFVAPLKSKEAINIRVELEKIFCYFGPPSIFHSDNGREFVNKCLHEMLESWPSEVQIIQGRPRHPQSQGMVEQAHINVETKIAAKITELSENESAEWSKWLPHICCRQLDFQLYNYKNITCMKTYHVYCVFLIIDAINTQNHSATGISPYELVFGQRPPSAIIPTTGKSSIIHDPNLDNNEDIDFHSLPTDEQQKHMVAKGGNTDDADLPNTKTDNAELSAAVELEEENVNQVATDNEEDDFVTTMNRHKKVRQPASKNIKCAQNIMKVRFEKKHKSRKAYFVVGDNVSVRIPPKDRTSTDLLRLPCVVIEVTGEKMKYYKLLSEFGVLNCTYRAGDLEKYEGHFDINVEEAENKCISLRSASIMTNSRNITKTASRCMCHTSCLIGKCRCLKRKRTCSSKCHPEQSCNNMETKIKKIRQVEAPGNDALLAPSFGGNVEIDGTFTTLQNTCPVDTWLALLKVVLCCSSSMKEQTQKACGEKTKRLFDFIDQNKYLEAKLQVANDQNVKLPNYKL
ncbi:uncharacterized protein LOC130622082 [Hydractinia symbiolongicarpus]|uniref:uncharacterized protein LOC130622082 n=1 Tax=Hydractinia symbiolongicarpus TaxID=13093 RepID=UPI00254FD7B4|nr:uncharacterized protein LOC130622082 [Hydractinia symbiolongicarpus]